MSESISYHNTTNQDKEFVVKEMINCKSQEEIIYLFFKNGNKYSPWQIHDLYPKLIPITSVRRAISNLKYEGKLIKLDETKIGFYGKPEHYFKIAGQLKMEI